MRVILAEKPSVAQSIAAVLGADQKKNGYLQGENDLVSWCIGHLIELAPPEIYDARYAKWRREDLPIVPSAWESVVSDGTKKQFAVLKDLLNRTDVDEVVCATDAGREGELIFRMVYEKTGCIKPVKRLWISSLEESAIREGFRALKSGAAYDALYRAALCRARADWLVGINGTRLYSRLYGTKLNVGRVMTPTLAMVVQREKEIGERMLSTSTCRNPNLKKVLYQLKSIEKNEMDSRRAVKTCGCLSSKFVIQNTKNAFRIILPNSNVK